MAAKRAAIKTSDVPTAPKTDINMASTIAMEDIERPDLAIVTDDTLESPHIKEYLNDLKFMEEILTISISLTNDKNAERVVPCGVNGEVKHLERGKAHKIARKFVESLIKVEDRVETEQYKDASGIDQTRIIKIPALKYPLSIHHDPSNERTLPNGKRVGDAWFEHQCSISR